MRTATVARSFVFALCVVTAATPAVEAGVPAAGALDAYLEARAALGQFNGTALVATDGQVLLEKGYGFADFSRHAKAGASTRYELASLTKSFTAAAILQLQEAGTLSVKDALCRWIAPCPDTWNGVTLDQLLHHTSGIPDYEASLEPDSEAYRTFMRAPNSAARIIERERSLPLDFAPGSKFHYSNTGYVLLGLVIERASGTSYDAYLAAHVLTPAGLSRAAVPAGAAAVPDLATGYSRLSDDMRAVAAGISLSETTTGREPALPMDGAHGDAKLIATAHDLWMWTRALEAHTVLSADSETSMLTSGPGAYGMGWYVGERWGQRMLSHTGYLPGYASIVEWYPDSHTAVILTTNLTGPRLNLVARDLGAIVFGKPYDVRVPHPSAPFDSGTAAQLAGKYTLADGRTANVAVRDDMLMVAVPGAFNAGAFAVSRDEFYAPFFENTVRFERNPDGTGRRLLIRFFGETWTGTRAS
jgi:CubicO group peptidase (beta-lactamase class C family)